MHFHQANQPVAAMCAHDHVSGAGDLGCSGALRCGSDLGVAVQDSVGVQQCGYPAGVGKMGL
jgi:hypothetical protein